MHCCSLSLSLFFFFFFFGEGGGGGRYSKAVEFGWLQANSTWTVLLVRVRFWAYPKHEEPCESREP